MQPAVLHHESDSSLMQVDQARQLIIWPTSRWGRRQAYLTCEVGVFETEEISESGAQPAKPILRHSGGLKCPWPQFCNDSSLLSAGLWQLPPDMPAKPKATPVDLQPEFEIARTEPR